MKERKYGCAMLAGGLDGLFFAPCDAPAFDAFAVTEMKKHISDDADAVCWRTPDGRIQSTFGFYSVSCLDKMRESAEAGKYKLSLFIESVSSSIIDTADCKIDEKYFRNINYAEDYRELRNMTYRPDTDISSENKQENYRVSLEDAVSMLRDLTDRIEDTEEVSLMEAAGRTLAEDIRAAFDQPPFPRSPLDGYAVIASDTEGAYPWLRRITKERLREGMARSESPLLATWNTGSHIRTRTACPDVNPLPGSMRQSVW